MGPVDAIPEVCWRWRGGNVKKKDIPPERQFAGKPVESPLGGAYSSRSQKGGKELGRATAA